MAESDLYQKIKWLVLCRFLFSVLLLGSTVIFQISHPEYSILGPQLFLYLLIFGLFFLSFVYYLLPKNILNSIVFTYFQIVIDTLCITVIIFLTGGFSSIFSFLYVLVIIYSSILLYWKGSLIIASLCSIQYYAMVHLEFAGILNISFTGGDYEIAGYTGSQIFYRVLITTVACFAVALLSSVLSEQARKTKNKLFRMEEQMKRVEKLALMGEMAAHLAHEIKNPLASLSGSIQLLRDEISYDPGHDRLMQIILRETDRLSALSNDFLFFAKPQMGKPEKIDLGRAINDTIALFEKDQSTKNIDIQCRMPQNIWVECDPMHLRQIIWNLLLNSAESIHDSGAIQISTRPLKDSTVEISISDNGCGIEKKVLKSIFDPFYTTKPNGTGLGLSIIHSLLEGNNSTIDVESEQGKGTTIRIKLKMISDPAANYSLTPYDK